MKMKLIHYGVAAAAALTVIALITFTVVLVVVIIRWNRKRIHCAHQGEETGMNTCIHSYNWKP